MRAHAGVVTAERWAEMAVSRHVISFRADPGVCATGVNVAAEESGGPAAMISFKQLVAVARLLRDLHKFAGALACQRRLASKVGREPETPLCSIQSRAVANLLRYLGCAAIRLLGRPALHAVDDSDCRTELQQQTQFAPHPLLRRGQRFGGLESGRKICDCLV